MRLYKLKIFAILGAAMIFAGSCKKSFFTNVNNNPNVVSTVAPKLLLPSAEIALGFTQGGDFSRYTSLITQQTFGFGQQTKTFYIYGINPGTFENGWADIYTSTMENVYSLKLIADANGYNAYSGVSKILLAYCMQMVVDMWGKVPYSQAFTGNLPGGTIAPKFDDDKALYDSIAALVDSGIVRLNNGASDVLSPGADDVIYNGDLTKWAKFGHAVKARLYIHQSKGTPAMASNALTEIAASFTSNADNAQYKFLGDGNTQSAWYQFLSSRQLYITFTNGTLAAQMTSLNDPRYTIFFDPANDLTGAASGNHYGGLADYYGANNAPVEFITYDELLFMKAEAALRANSDYANAQIYYHAAIDSNMSKLGVAGADISTYLAANGTLPVTGVDAAIAKVASQEYIALFLNPEAWVLYRRTGVPALNPTGPGAVPRRLIYPQSEYSLNAVNVPQSTLATPAIFWDK
jgi:hypothetical protein